MKTIKTLLQALTAIGCGLAGVYLPFYVEKDLSMGEWWSAPTMVVAAAVSAALCIASITGIMVVVSGMLEDKEKD